MKNISIITGLLLLLNWNTGHCQTGLKTSSSGKDAALETLGSTSAMLLYNTYICIGSIADGYDKVNTKETVTTLLGEQVKGIEVIVKHYNKLLESGFLETDSDKEFVKKSIRCAGYLQMEAKSFKTYLETKSPEEANKYDVARNNAWNLIADLLGLDK